MKQMIKSLWIYIHCWKIISYTRNKVNIPLKKNRSCLVISFKETGECIPFTSKEFKILNIKEAIKHRDNLEEQYCQYHINLLFNYCVCNKGSCNELPCITDVDFK